MSVYISKPLPIDKGPKGPPRKFIVDGHPYRGVEILAYARGNKLTWRALLLKLEQSSEKTRPEFAKDLKLEEKYLTNLLKSNQPPVFEVMAAFTAYVGAQTPEKEIQCRQFMLGIVSSEYTQGRLNKCFAASPSEGGLDVTATGDARKAQLQEFFRVLLNRHGVDTSRNLAKLISKGDIDVEITLSEAMRNSLSLVSKAATQAIQRHNAQHIVDFAYPKNGSNHRIREKALAFLTDRTCKKAADKSALIRPSTGLPWAERHLETTQPASSESLHAHH